MLTNFTHEETQNKATSIKNFNANMAYRRFGKTEAEISAITLGGMRYVQVNAQPRHEVPRPTIDECIINVEEAFKSGINHIETAFGYGNSEHCYGIALNDELKIPRNNYYLMTKGDPQTADEARTLVEGQLKALKTDYVDFYAWHGINTLERNSEACCSGGPVEELLKMKNEGIIGSVGFSTHGQLTTITRAIGTELFDFVNLHYYYFFQRNLGAIHLAEEQDMGVFIISPNDKGGQLFNAPNSLRKITSPLTPIQWNARFCLRLPSVHTLSFGMTAPSHYKEMRGIMPLSYPFSKEDVAIEKRLNALLEKDPYYLYGGYNLPVDSSKINVGELIRFYRLWKNYGMEDFITYRYNMLEQKNHWFPGQFATDEILNDLDVSRVPAGIDLVSMLKELHERFYKPKK